MLRLRQAHSGRGWTELTATGGLQGAGGLFVGTNMPGGLTRPCWRPAGQAGLPAATLVVSLGSGWHASRSGSGPGAP